MTWIKVWRAYKVPGRSRHTANNFKVPIYWKNCQALKNNKKTPKWLKTKNIPDFHETSKSSFNPCALKVGMYSGASTMEKSTAVPPKFTTTHYHMIYQFHFWVLPQKNWKQGLDRYLYTRVSSIIHNSQNVDVIQVPVNRQMDKQRVGGVCVYVYI